LPLVGLIVSAAITAEFPQGYNLPYFIFGATKVKLELFFTRLGKKFTTGMRFTEGETAIRPLCWNVRRAP